MKLQLDFRVEFSIQNENQNINLKRRTRKTVVDVCYSKQIIEDGKKALVRRNSIAINSTDIIINKRIKSDIIKYRQDGLVSSQEIKNRLNYDEFINNWPREKRQALENQILGKNALSTIGKNKNTPRLMDQYKIAKEFIDKEEKSLQKKIRAKKKLATQENNEFSAKIITESHEQDMIEEKTGYVIKEESLTQESSQESSSVPSYEEKNIFRHPIIPLK